MINRCPSGDRTTYKAPSEERQKTRLSSGQGVDRSCAQPERVVGRLLGGAWSQRVEEVSTDGWAEPRTQASRVAPCFSWRVDGAWGRPGDGFLALWSRLLQMTAIYREVRLDFLPIWKIPSEGPLNDRLAELLKAPGHRRPEELEVTP